MNAKPTIDQLINEIEKFVSERDWRQYHSVKNLSMALSVEISELVELSQWLTQDESNSPCEELLERYKEESADVFIYLLLISRKLNFDLVRAAFDKINQNEIKYPMNKSRGSRKKYTDL